MATTTDPRIPTLLARARAGELEAEECLQEILYREMRRLAAHHLRDQASPTLRTTELIHESFLRLAQSEATPWEDSARLCSLASRVMRSVLVDRARRRAAAKRGGGWRRSPLDEGVCLTEDPASDLLALHEALERLSELDPVKAQLVELRFFGGSSIEETARVLGISTASVKRSWRVAKAWLRREITGEEA